MLLMDMFIMYCLLNRRIKEPLCDVNAMAEKKEDAAGLPRSDFTSPTFTPTQDIQLQHERYAERAIEPW